MRFLLLLLLSTNAFAQLTEINKQDLAYRNKLLNSGFENGKTYWTPSAGTFTIATTGVNLGEGTQSGCFTPSAATQTLTAKQVSVDAALYGSTCEARYSFRGGDTNLTFEVIDGTNAVLASAPLFVSANYSQRSVFFTCPSSGTFTVRLKSTASGAQACMDSLYLGKQVQQTFAVNPIAYEETRDIGIVGSVANEKAPLADADFPVPANVRYWYLAGDSLEDSGNADITLTQNGSPAFNSTGFFGRENVINFDGVNDFLSSSDAYFDVTTQDFVVGGFFTLKTLGVYNSFFSKWDGSSNQRSYIAYMETNNTLNILTSGDGTTFASHVFSLPFVVDKEFHLAVVFNNTGNTIEVYFNGQKSYSGSFATNLFDSNQDFKLRSHNTTSPVYSGGIVQDVFFYKGGTLTDAQINALASKRFSNHKQIAAGHELTTDSFPFDNLTGKVSFYNLKNVNDGSVNAKNLTASGSPVFTGSSIYGVGDIFRSDGVDDRLSSTDAFFSSDEVTVWGWFYRPSWLLGTTEYFLSTDLNNTNRSSAVYLTSTDFGVNISIDGTIGNTKTVRIPSSSLSPGFHHIAYTHKGNYTKLYVDGVVAAEGVTSTLFKTTGSFTVNDQYSGSTVSPFEGSIQDAGYSKIAFSDEDIYKLYSARVDLTKQVAKQNQDWSATLWGRSDDKINNQLKPDWLVDSAADKVYIAIGLPADSAINLKMRDTGMSGVVTAAVTMDTGLLSTSPTFPLAHGLGRMPTGVRVVYENGTIASYFDTRDDLCSFNATLISCDLSSLGTIDGTHRVQILATSVPGGFFAPAATDTSPGLVTTENIRNVHVASDAAIAGSKIQAATTSTFGVVKAATGFFTFVDGDTTDVVGTGSYSGTVYWTLLDNVLSLRAEIPANGNNIFTITIPTSLLKTSISRTTVGVGKRERVLRTGNQTLYNGSMIVTDALIQFEKLESSTTTTTYIWLCDFIIVN